MNAKTNTHCYAPSHSIVINSEGKIAPCCSYLGSQTHINDPHSLKPGNLFSLYKDLDSIMEQQAIPLGCKTCFQNEKDGVLSKREKISRNYKRIKQDTCTTYSHAEVSLSNTCNLDCIMCNAQYSSKWLSTHKKMCQTSNKNLKNLHHYYQSSSATYNLDREKTIELAQSLNAVKNIEILGGEPLLYKNFPLFISTLAKNPQPPESIEMTTNLTTLTDQIIQLFQENSHIEFIFSVSTDATEKLYTYIRGYSFKKLDSNIDQLLKQSFCKKLFIKPTFGFINALSFLDLYQWAQTKKTDKRIIVHSTQFLRPTEPTSFIGLPKELRQNFIERLKTSPIYQKEQSSIDTIIQHLQTFPLGHKENFKQAAEYVRFFNQHRDLNLFELNPNLNYLNDYI